MRPAPKCSCRPCRVMQASKAKNLVAGQVDLQGQYPGTIKMLLNQASQFTEAKHWPLSSMHRLPELLILALKLPPSISLRTPTSIEG